MDNGHLHYDNKGKVGGVRNLKFLSLFSLLSDADANKARGSNALFTIEIYGFSRRAATDHLLEVSLGRLKRLIECKREEVS